MTPRRSSSGSASRILFGRYTGVRPKTTERDAVTDRSTSRWWVLLTVATLLLLLALTVYVSK
jgi:hypothetical protein